MKLCTALLFLWAAAAGAAEELTIETLRRDATVEVRAHALIQASHATIWNTLTDYDHLAEFVPGMRSSRVVGRQGDALVVEQVGEARFLVFTFPVRVTVLATARPPDAIEVRLLKGNLRRLDGGYMLRRAGPGKYALRWVGLLEPESLPPLLGEMVMRANIAGQFEGMVREIERREARQR